MSRHSSYRKRALSLRRIGKFDLSLITRYIPFILPPHPDSASPPLISLRDLLTFPAHAVFLPSFSALWSYNIFRTWVEKMLFLWRWRLEGGGEADRTGFLRGRVPVPVAVTPAETVIPVTSREPRPVSLGNWATRTRPHRAGRE